MNPVKQNKKAIIATLLFLLMIYMLYKIASADADTIKAALASLEHPAKTADKYINISFVLVMRSNIVSRHKEYVKIMQKVVVQR